MGKPRKNHYSDRGNLYDARGIESSMGKKGNAFLASGDKTYRPSMTGKFRICPFVAAFIAAGEKNSFIILFYCSS